MIHFLTPVLENFKSISSRLNCLVCSISFFWHLGHRLHSMLMILFGRIFVRLKISMPLVDDPQLTVCSHEDLLTLVIKVGAFIDVLEIL